MLLIFLASGDSMSMEHSSQFLGPIILWLFPDIPPRSFASWLFVMRKCAHLTEYAILAVLVWRAIRKPVAKDPRGWCWRNFWAALAIAAIYAITDEVHQSFVKNRWGTATDVLIDTAGAAAGLSIVYLAFRVFVRSPRGAGA